MEVLPLVLLPSVLHLHSWLPRKFSSLSLLCCSCRSCGRCSPRLPREKATHVAGGSRFQGSCFTHPLWGTELQRGPSGEGCRSQGEHTTAGDRVPLLCIVFNPLTIILCLNGIREATRELYCQAHHGNTSALKTYQLLGALTHCFLSSSRSCFLCAVSTLQAAWPSQEVLPSSSPSDSYTEDQWSTQTGNLHNASTVVSSHGPSSSFPPARHATWASPWSSTPLMHRQQLGTSSSGSSAPCLPPEEKADDVLLCLLFPLCLCESREVTTAASLSGGWGGRYKHVGEKRISLNKAQANWSRNSNSTCQLRFNFVSVNASFEQKHKTSTDTNAVLYVLYVLYVLTLTKTRKVAKVLQEKAWSLI